MLLDGCRVKRHTRSCQLTSIISHKYLITFYKEQPKYKYAALIYKI